MLTGMPGTDACAVVSQSSPSTASSATAAVVASIEMHTAASARRAGVRFEFMVPLASTDMREDSVELVERVIADDELALPRRRMLKLDRRAELVGEVVLEPLDVRVLRTRPAGTILAAASVSDEAPHERFRLADREALLRDERADLGLLFRRGQCQERAGMTHLELALLDERADGRRQ